VGVEYLKEIGRGVDTILAGVVANDTTVRFRFFDPTAVYAAGFVTVGEPC